MPGTVRERGGADEPRRGRVPDKERRDCQLEFVGSTGGKELGEHGGAALDHQPAYPPGREIGEHGLQGGRLAGVDDRRRAGQPGAGAVHRLAGRIHQPGGVTGSEETRRRVKIAGPGQGDLHRAGRQPPRAPRRAPRRGAHQQPGIVTADRPRTDQDRIAASPGLVDPVQVSGPGEAEPRAAGVVDVAVDGRGRRQQYIRPLSHSHPLPLLAHRATPP